jgi:hypothetical protein
MGDAPRFIPHRGSQQVFVPAQRRAAALFVDLFPAHEVDSAQHADAPTVLVHDRRAGHHVWQHHGRGFGECVTRLDTDGVAIHHIGDVETRQSWQRGVHAAVSFLFDGRWGA